MTDDETGGVSTKIKAMSPDYVLRIDEQALLRAGGPAMTFVAELQSYPGNRVVWWGNFHVNIDFIQWLDTSGATLTQEVVKALQNDKILNSCLP